MLYDSSRCPHPLVFREAYEARILVRAFSATTQYTVHGRRFISPTVLAARSLLLCRPRSTDDHVHDGRLSGYSVWATIGLARG